jgi:hypothetical protein
LWPSPSFSGKGLAAPADPSRRGLRGHCGTLAQARALSPDGQPEPGADSPKLPAELPGGVTAPGRVNDHDPPGRSRPRAPELDDRPLLYAARPHLLEGDVRLRACRGVDNRDRRGAVAMDVPANAPSTRENARMLLPHHPWKDRKQMRRGSSGSSDELRVRRPAREPEPRALTTSRAHRQHAHYDDPD